jgi:purine-binding chemotaxis protein CheW
MTSDSTAPEGAGDRLLIVELRGGLYGVDADAVREIVGFQAATRLPGAPPYVRGVVNLRGQLLTVVDMSHRITGTPLAATEGSIVVVSSDERVLGLLVGDVHEIQEVPVMGAERDILARAEGLLTGVGRLGDEVVLVVDIPELVRQTLA